MGTTIETLQKVVRHLFETVLVKLLPSFKQAAEIKIQVEERGLEIDLAEMPAPPPGHDSQHRES